MRGVRTKIYRTRFNQIAYESIETYHNRDIKAALNTVRENLGIGYDEDLFLTYCDNKKQEKVMFKITMLGNENYELFIGYLEVLK